MASVATFLVVLLGAWNLYLAQEAADRYGEDDSSYDRVTLVFGFPLAVALFSPLLYFPAVWLCSWIACRRYTGFVGWIVWPFIGPLDLALRVLGLFGRRAELPAWAKLRWEG
jgi:hypothetical protein